MQDMNSSSNVRFEVFAAVSIRITVFWDVILHSFVHGYQFFRGTYNSSTLEMEAVGTLKHWYPSTTLQSDIPEKHNLELLKYF
jgi:hypothetical protein